MLGRAIVAPRRRSLRITASCRVQVGRAVGRVNVRDPDETDTDQQGPNPESTDRKVMPSQVHPCTPYEEQQDRQAEYTVSLFARCLSHAHSHLLAGKFSVLLISRAGAA